MTGLPVAVVIELIFVPLREVIAGPRAADSIALRRLAILFVIQKQYFLPGMNAPFVVFLNCCSCGIPSPEKRKGRCRGYAQRGNGNDQFPIYSGGGRRYTRRHLVLEKVLLNVRCNCHGTFYTRNSARLNYLFWFGQWQNLHIPVVHDIHCTPLRQSCERPF